jgi:hypothetical protein
MAKQPEAEGVNRGMLPSEQDAAGTLAGPTGNTGVKGGGDDGRGGGGSDGIADATGPTGNTGPSGKTGPTSAQPTPSAGQATQSGASLPKFDHATALEFYNAIHPSAFMLGYDRGRSILNEDQFRALAQEADCGHEHLFFHAATLKSEWADPQTHEKGKITTASKDKAVNMLDGSASHVRECHYLWGDCDAAKYEGTNPSEAKVHYEREGTRVEAQVMKDLTDLALNRSPCGGQALAGSC